MFTRAKIHGAEQALQRCVSDDIARIGRRRIQDLWRTMDANWGRSTRVRVAKSNVQNGVMNLHQSAVGQRGMIPVTVICCEAFNERLSVIANDMPGGVNSALHQSNHRLIARCDLINSL